LGWDWSGCK